MTLVTSAEMGPYNPSPHSLPETHNGLDVAGSKNPYRTVPDNAPQHKYPVTYKGFRIVPDREYQHLLRVTAPDGTDLGMFRKEEQYTAAIDAYLNIEEQFTITNQHRSEYEEAQRTSA